MQAIICSSELAIIKDHFEDANVGVSFDFDSRRRWKGGGGHSWQLLQLVIDLLPLINRCDTTSL